MAELVVDRDEPGGVAEAVDAADRVHAGERRHDHRVRERQRASALELDLAVADLVDGAVGQAFDPQAIEEALDPLRGVPDAAEAEWPR